MAKPFEMNIGGWWRFHRYEIRDGYIRPVKGEKNEWYDPWEAYRKSWDEEAVFNHPDETPTFEELRRTGPPYVSLLNLLNQVTFRPMSQKRLYEITPESEGLLLSWCSQHGLLGLLPHQARMIFLMPTGVPKFGPFARKYKEGDLIQPKDIAAGFQTSYILTNLGWKGYDTSYFNQKEDEWPPPGALIQELHRIRLRQMPLRDSVGRFFPDVPEDEREIFQYPEPGYEEFWQEYSEPIDDFFCGAIALKDAVKQLNHIKPIEALSKRDTSLMWQGVELLHALVAPISLAMLPHKDGTYRQLWVAPSLLSSFAAMLLQDLCHKKKRLLRCENDSCGGFFVTESYQARYCSNRCRNAVQKRKYRAGLKKRTMD
jgi:hypothetical protein